MDVSKKLRQNLKIIIGLGHGLFLREQFPWLKKQKYFFNCFVFPLLSYWVMIN